MTTGKPTKDRSEWFRPLWVRLSFIGICGAWLILETVNGERLWAAIAFAVLCWGIWEFLIRYDRKPADDKKDEE